MFGLLEYQERHTAAPAVPHPGARLLPSDAQDVFARDGALADGASTGAVLCGQKQMCEQITQILVERGVAKENILLNF
jgi:hypothetical protein